MVKIKYNEIYTAPREKMEDGTHALQELLSSEDTLVGEFDRSRNTIRWAIRQLVSEGYVQNIHDRGVRIVYQPGQQQSEFILGGIGSLKGAVARSRKNHTTKVACSAELTVDGTIRRRTTFPVGARIYYTQRVRRIEGEALIIDHNYFLKDVVRDLTPEIAECSIYEYVGNDLGKSTVTTKRKTAVECVNQINKKYLDLKDYNCVAVVGSMTYNKKGVMSEFTQSRHRPDRFMFYDLAHRAKQIN